MTPLDATDRRDAGSTALAALRSRLGGPAPLWAVSALLALATAVVYAAAVSDLAAPSTAAQLDWWLLVVLFFATCAVNVPLYVGREEYVFTLGEIVLVPALFFADPETLLLATAAGLVADLGLHRRQAPVRLAFNLTQHTFVVALAVWVFHAVLGDADPIGPAGWAAAAAATATITVLGVAVVLMALSLLQGQALFGAAPAQLAFSLAAGAVNTALGLLAVEVLALDPQGMWLMAVPVATAVVAARALGAARLRRERMAGLNTAFRADAAATGQRLDVAAILAQGQALFRADVAEIVLAPDAGDAPARRATLGPDGRTRPLAPTRLHPAEHDLVRRVADRGSLAVRRDRADGPLAAYLTERRLAEVLVATLAGDGGPIGVLLLGRERLGEFLRFDNDDALAFETFASHATVALRNADLAATQAELAESRKLYRALVDHMPLVMYRDSLDGTGLYVSPYVSTAFGHDPAEWLGGGSMEDWWQRHVHPDDLAQMRRDGTLAADRRGEPYTARYRLRRADGSYAWVEEDTVIVADDTGAPAWRQGIIRDVTAEVEAGQALDEHERRYRTLVEQLPVVTFVTELDGTLRYISPQVETVLGYTPDEWARMDATGEWLDAVHPEDVERTADATAAITAGRIHEYDVQLRMLTRGGDVRNVHARARRLEDDDGRASAIQGVLIDVTDLRRAEERSQQVMAALVKAAEEEQARIAAELHDDTVQVMAAAVMQLELLRGADERRVQRLRTMLRDALDRTRHLMFELRPQLLERDGLAAALQEIVSGDWKATVDVDVPRQSETVEALVYRSIRELVVNARKHSHARTLTVRGRQEGRELVFEVADDGIGFVAEEALDRSRMRMHLGLDTTIERISIAGGSVTLETAPGEGTHFCIRMPASPRPAPRADHSHAG